ncbi:MAG: radical SAM protein [Thermodesulfobacteriota bacterium]
MQIQLGTRKSRILKKAQFGCLQESFSLNITQGCSLGCVYCYARAYPGAPGKDRILLYPDLPAKLARELDSPSRRLKVENVCLNTATDCFQENPSILKVAYETLQILLLRGVQVSFLTKGRIPEPFFLLFSRHAQQIKASVGLVSVSEAYRQVFEPGAASINQRLENISKLQQAGVEVQVRVDPIIPFITDDQGSITDLLTALANRKVSRISLSYLHLRPRILEHLRQELPALEFKLLQSCFWGKEWTNVGTSTRSKLVPASIRQQGYSRFTRYAHSLGLRSIICACKNPDIPAQICTTRGKPSATEKPLGRAKQARLPGV